MREGEKVFLEEFPKFEKGCVLKANQLVLLRDFPREMATIEYAGYGDGILFGCHAVAEKDAITVAPGVILRNGSFFRMPVPMSVPYGAGDAMQYIKVRFTEEISEKDVNIQKAEIVIDGDPASEDQLELGRFKLKSGAKLRSDYTDFGDLITEFDTLNLIHSPHACRGGQTLPPFVTDFFAGEAISANPRDPVDACFCMVCLQGERVHLHTIQAYLDLRSADPREIYFALLERLGRIKGAKGGDGRMERKQNRILVD